MQCLTTKYTSELGAGKSSSCHDDLLRALIIEKKKKKAVFK
jgi:hypothetical protein